jgi:hypothetical protein
MEIVSLVASVFMAVFIGMALKCFRILFDDRYSEDERLARNKKCQIKLLLVVLAAFIILGIYLYIASTV